MPESFPHGISFDTDLGALRHVRSIDENYRNYVEVSTIIGNTSENEKRLFWTQHSILGLRHAPLLAISPDSNTVGGIEVAIRDVQLAPDDNSHGVIRLFVRGVGGTGRYIIRVFVPFDENMPLVQRAMDRNDPMGFQIRDSANRVTFDSRATPMDVLKVGATGVDRVTPSDWVVIPSATGVLTKYSGRTRYKSRGLKSGMQTTYYLEAKVPVLRINKDGTTALRTSYWIPKQWIRKERGDLLDVFLGGLIGFVLGGPIGAAIGMGAAGVSMAATVGSTQSLLGNKNAAPLIYIR